MVKWLWISWVGFDIAPTASGWPSCTVLLSNFDHWSSPNNLAAAICSTMAWVDTFTVGTAILSPGPKSLMVLMRSSRLIRLIGCAEVATMPLTPPLVRSHSSSRLPVPVHRISTPPASSASVCAPPPESVTHLVVTSVRPSSAACFSISFCFSMMWVGI